MCYFQNTTMKDHKKTGGFKKKSFGTRPSFGARPSYASKGSRPSFGARDTSGPLEMHQAECNSCHKMCEVPFKPNGKKPVYCRDCFREGEAAHAAPARATAPGTSTDNGYGDLKKQFAVLNTKLDRLAAAIEAQTASQAAARE